MPRGSPVTNASFSHRPHLAGPAVSFVFINNEDRKDEEEGLQGAEPIVNVEEGIRRLSESFHSRRSSRASVQG